MPDWSPPARRIVAVAATLPAAGLVTSTEAGFCLLLLVGWAIALLAVRRAGRSAGKQRSTAVRWSAGTMAAVMIGGCLAPGKRIDRLLDRPVSLHRTAYTVAELNEEARRWDDPAFPVFISFPDEGVAAHTVRVTFPSTEMTLREFVRQVEMQTGLKHSFAGCGNAYTILDGPAYHFGLMFLPPPAEREYGAGGMRWVRPGEGDEQRPERAVE